MSDETRLPTDDDTPDRSRDEGTGPDFATSAREARSGLIAEFKDFLLENKKWWLAPIVVSVLLLGGLILLGGTAAAPFIYTLF